MKLLSKLKRRTTPGGQLVSNEVAIGQNVLSIHARKRLFGMTYAIYVRNGDRYFEHSHSCDLQNIMADFTRLCSDYRKMIDANIKR